MNQPPPVPPPPPTPQPKGISPGTGCLVVVIATIVGAVVLSLAGVGDDGSSGGSDDAGAELACSHFHNVAVDASEGILTGSELREKLQEIDDSASVSEDAAVRTAARSMLAANTAGDRERFEQAVGSMSDACDAYRDG